MTFNQAAKPYIAEKLALANQAFQHQDDETGFKALEDAHVIGQQSTYFHMLVHFEMLKFGLRRGDINEVLGQIFRLVGALTKTVFGLLPAGNTGGSNVSPFKPMPISAENQAILNRIHDAQSSPRT